MDYSPILAVLRQASAFDLYRLRAAIDRVLDEPEWMVAVALPFLNRIVDRQAGADTGSLPGTPNGQT